MSRSMVQFLYENEDRMEELDYKPARCVWTLSTGRAGSMWLLNLLNQFETVKAFHEPGPSLFFLNRLAVDHELEWDQDQVKRMVREMRKPVVNAAYHRGQTMVDVSTHQTHLAFHLARAFPTSKFLHLVRDPREFVSSALPRHWYRYDNAKSHWWPRSVPYEEPWQRLIWYWDLTHSRALHVEKRHKTLRVMSRAMWTDTETLNGLVFWLGVSDHELRYHAGTMAACQARPVNAGGKLNTAWDPAWDPFLREVAGRTMDKLGIE